MDSEKAVSGGAPPPLVVRVHGHDRSLPGSRSYLVGRDPQCDVEGNVRRIFDKLGLADTPQDNRRVLAVLAFLRA